MQQQEQNANPLDERFELWKDRHWHLMPRVQQQGLEMAFYAGAASALAANASDQCVAAIEGHIARARTWEAIIVAARK